MSKPFYALIVVLLTFFLGLECESAEGKDETGKINDGLCSIPLILELQNEHYGTDKIQVMDVYTLDEKGYRILASRKLEVRKNGEIIASSPLPSFECVKNLMLNQVVETEDGFDLYISWGGGKNYYDLVASVLYSDHDFFITQVKATHYRLGADEEEVYIRRFIPKRNLKMFDLRRELFGENGDTFSFSTFERVGVVSLSSTLTTNPPPRGAAGSGGSEPSNP